MDKRNIIEMILKLRESKENIESIKDIYSIDSVEAIIDNYIDKLKSKFDIIESDIESYKNNIENNDENNVKQNLPQVDYSYINNILDDLKNSKDITVHKIEEDINLLRSRLSQYDKETLEKLGLYDLYLVTNDIINEIMGFNYVDLNSKRISDLVVHIDEKIEELIQLKESNELLKQSIEHSESIKEIDNILSNKITEDIKDNDENINGDNDIDIQDIEINDDILDNVDIIEDSELENSEAIEDIEDIIEENKKQPWYEKAMMKLKEKKSSLFKKKKKDDENDIVEVLNGHSDIVEDIYEDEVLPEEDSNQDIESKIEEKDEELENLTFGEEIKENKKGNIKFIVTIVILSLLAAGIVVLYQLGYLDPVINRFKELFQQFDVNGLVDKIKEIFNNIVDKIKNMF